MKYVGAWSMWCLSRFGSDSTSDHRSQKCFVFKSGWDVSQQPIPCLSTYIAGSQTAWKNRCVNTTVVQDHKVTLVKKNHQKNVYYYSVSFKNCTPTTDSWKATILPPSTFVVYCFSSYFWNLPFILQKKIQIEDCQKVWLKFTSVQMSCSVSVVFQIFVFCNRYLIQIVRQQSVQWIKQNIVNRKGKLFKLNKACAFNNKLYVET